MRQPVLLVIFLLNIFSAYSQLKGTNTISGKILDSATRLPLEYATVTLFLQQQNKPVNGATTDKEGSYVITDVKDSIFNIVFEYIGYNSFTLKDVVITGKTTSLKTISLSRKDHVLQGVTVVTQGKVIENKIDKMVFNAERDITSQSGVATDVLRKVPQVSVDVDGNVELAGSSGIRFLINGKPSTAFGSSIADVLQSIPASQIKSIEVITNPGAKYDAAGIGGIINIILKSNRTKGYNGNISLTAGTRQENGSMNFNVRNNNFGVNAFVSGNARLRFVTPFYSERISQNGNNQQVLFIQEGSSEFIRKGYQTGIGFDWTLQKKNTISGSLSYNHFSSKGESHDMQSLMGTTGNIFSRINTNNNFSSHSIDADVTYKRTFNKEDEELEININSSIYKDVTTGRSSQYLVPTDSLYYGTISNNPGKEGETEITADYTLPLRDDVVLGIGSKANFYEINSNSEVMRYLPLSKQYAFNSSLSNSLDYKQQVYAFYSEIAFPVAKLFDAKIGGRYERTEIDAYYSNALQQVKIPGYNTFVPSIYFSKKLGEDQVIKFSYSKRIGRPEYRDLNPFVNTNDPKNLSVGNPYLQPEFRNRYELAYSREIEKVGSVMLSVYYGINNDDIQPYIIYYSSYKAGDSTYKDVSVTSRQNIGIEKNTGANLFADVHLSTKITVRTNFSYFHRHTNNKVDPDLNSNNFNYRFNLNGTCQLTPTLAAEFFGNFSSVRHEAQGTYPAFTSYSFAVRKQFWNKKGSLAFATNNPFAKYVAQTTKLFGPNFSSVSTRQIPFRTFSLNFTWKFGKLEFKEKEKEESNLNNPIEN